MRVKGDVMIRHLRRFDERKERQVEIRQLSKKRQLRQFDESVGGYEDQAVKTGKCVYLSCEN